MKENVLVLGCNGYIGNALVQKLLFNGYNVFGVDNDIKHKWTKEIGPFSIIPTKPIAEKVILFNKIGSFTFQRIDIAKEPEELKELLIDRNFSTVVNLAQQPSASFSHLSLSSAIETLNNNTNGTLNVLWLLSVLQPDTHYIEIESMGCHAPDINVDIPEGYFKFFGKHDKIPAISSTSIFPKRPGSLYHISKVTNTYLVDCANRWWGLNITAINQGIVYGNKTEEIEETGIHSPLWIDECFGTVINRFIAQSLLDLPLTIYGGNQKRGFISLQDCIQALMLLVENKPINNGPVRFVNQLDNVYSINEIYTNFFNNQKTIIESPRVENTEDFYYRPETNILISLGYKGTSDIIEQRDFAYKHINKKLLKKSEYLLKDPKINWRRNV